MKSLSLPTPTPFAASRERSPARRSLAERALFIIMTGLVLCGVVDLEASPD
ncbi:hypothetical protein [Truepera radiovictrix]|uniref:hypothetical protein n=1 Tax=Truepera radiovictrix TaxID=332249 RepID=UPI0002DF2803|nr:hypothetical protein [Truepera radiovictrix]